MKYLCPICEKGFIEITEERTGSPGFRITDYNIISNTCNCITSKSENTAIAIMSYKDKELIQKDVCEECKVEKPTINYPIKSWLGEFKDICTHCFEKEMKKLSKVNND